jgi:hypothetical protein
VFSGQPADTLGWSPEPMTNAECKIYKEVIDRYILKNPVEWEGFLQYVKETRASLADKKFGQSETEKNMRFGGSMPTKLYNQIRLAAFRFFNHDIDLDSFDRDFLNQFKQFRIAEKI